jgi:predicted Zn-dependent peptidase
MEAVGGELNAYTTKEETFLYSICLSEHAERAIELLADLAFHSRFPEAEIGKEREVVLDEIRSYEDNPAEAIFDEFENNLFKGSEMGRSILGLEADLCTFTSATCRDFADRFYYPENIVFFFHGKLPWTKIIRLAARYLGGETGSVRRETQTRQRIRPIAPEPIRERVDKDLHQSHVMLGSRAYGMYEGRRIGLHLLNNLLGGPGMNSRLNVSLRERRGLVYAVDSSAIAYSDVGAFSIYFGCDRESVGRCLRLVRSELRRLRETALSSSQLRAAVRQLKGQMGVATDQHENVALGMGKSLLHYDRYDDLPEIYAQLDALTATDLREIANEIFDERLSFELIFE